MWDSFTPGPPTFGLRSCYGFCFQDLQIEGGLGTLEIIIRSVKTPSYTQSIIITFLCHWKHVSNMPHPLFQFPNVCAPHLEGCLYKCFCAFLAKHDLSLQVEGIDVSTPPRNNNRCITEVSCNDATIKDSDIKRIYYCKSYLQVKWISDLCMADVSEVLKSIKNGI